MPADERGDDDHDNDQQGERAAKDDPVGRAGVGAGAALPVANPGLGYLLLRLPRIS